MKKAYTAPNIRQLGELTKLTQGLLNDGCSDAVFGVRGEGILACLVDGSS